MESSKLLFKKCYKTYDPWKLGGNQINIKETHRKMASLTTPIIQCQGENLASNKTDKKLFYEKNK